MKRGPKVFYGEKGWRMVRLWETLMLLVEAEKPLTAEEVNSRLARNPTLREFKGKVATTRDDLKTLARCEFPVKLVDAEAQEIDLREYLDDTGSNRGKLKNTRWTMKSGVDVGKLSGAHHRKPTAADLTALALLRNLLQDEVPESFPFYDHVRGLCDALTNWYPKHGLNTDRADVLRRFLKSTKRYLKSGASVRVIECVAEALRKQSVVEGLYQSAHGKESIVRVLPLSVWMAEGRAHLLAAHTGDGALRTYRLDRFVSLKPLPGQKPPKVNQKEVDLLLASSFGGFVGTPEKVILHVDPRIAYLFDEYQFHPSQRTTKRKDGSRRVRLDCAISLSLEEWILGFGEHVEVIEPEWLCRNIASRHQAAAKRYGNKKRGDN